ncbi:MAG: hypothetical protein ACI84C_002860 [Flavobacteriales bacterium]|jgi:hypothetical protein
MCRKAKLIPIFEILNLEITCKQSVYVHSIFITTSLYCWLFGE